MNQDYNIPFYDMANSKDFHPGVWPESPTEIAKGLKKSIEAVKKKIKDQGTSPDLELHLKNLEQHLKEVENKTNQVAQ